MARLLERYGTAKDPAVLAGPAVGVDAAAVRTKGGVLVFASDPVTDAAKDIGWYAVHVNANDIFVSGARPLWFLADVLLPPGRGRLAETIFKQIHRVCEELGVTLIGGHTELTPDLPRPLVAGFMVGRAVGGQVLTSQGVRPGDVLILTKGVAVEGTAIIAREYERELSPHLPAAVLRRCKRMLSSPGISVGPEARIALRHGAHAMHDPTEGGLLNGLWEMAQAAGLALHVDTGRVAVFPETRAVCDHFNIDPLKLLASGALLIACPRRKAAGLTESLTRSGIQSSEIGEARKGKAGLWLGRKPIKSSISDEILKVVADARPVSP